MGVSAVGLTMTANGLRLGDVVEFENRPSGTAAE